MLKRFLKILDPKRFIEYFISGGAYFWFGYLVFFFADKGLGWSLFWAKLAANVSGWTLNYFLQRYWVFGDRKNKQGRMTWRYIAITLFNFGLDYVIVAGLSSLGVTPYLGQFVSSGFFTAWNYIWYRLWVFPARKIRRRVRKPQPKVVR